MPWGEFLKCPAVWAVIVAHFCYNWGYYSLLAWLPSYFEMALGEQEVTVGLWDVVGTVRECTDGNEFLRDVCSSSGVWHGVLGTSKGHPFHIHNWRIIQCGYESGWVACSSPGPTGFVAYSEARFLPGAAGLNVEKSSLLTLIPYIAMTIMTPLVGPVADGLVERGWSVTSVRKLSQVGCTGGEETLSVVFITVQCKAFRLGARGGEGRGERAWPEVGGLQLQTSAVAAG